MSPAVRETGVSKADRYDMLQPDVWHAVLERQGVLLALMRAHGWRDLQRLSVLDVGCGAGGTLLEFLRMGMTPSLLMGIDLLGSRLAQARRVLPADVRLQGGDAAVMPLPKLCFDLVTQYTMLSSIPDDGKRRAVAQAMWSCVKPGGVLLSYDFAFNSPSNQAVRRLTVRDLKQLFPQGRVKAMRRVTLAPPLARVIARVHPSLIPLARSLPFLRTHRMVWIQKAADAVS